MRVEILGCPLPGDGFVRTKMTRTLCRTGCRSELFCLEESLVLKQTECNNVSSRSTTAVFNQSVIF